MSETIKEETAEAVQAEPQGLTLEKFEEATEVVSKVISETKLVYSEYFSNLTGNKVYLKPENMQYTGAYKVRGAFYKISTLSDEEKQRGLITASAGNHAQGVAYAAKLAGCKATVVMPTTTPLMKVNRTRSYGAEVVLHGDVFDEALAYANELAAEHGYTFIHPFNDLDVATGQGTIAMEIIKELPTVDYILVPIGGGGLCTGVATLAKLLNPKIKVIGVEPAGANCMQESLKEGKVVTLPSVNTIADGTAVKRPGDLLFPYIQINVDDIITIEDSAELQITQIPNIVRLETRNATASSGESKKIDIQSLIRSSLRMRPDRIIVGEVRGAEALDMLQAMNTGHDGSLSTGHANSAEDMLSRLETMVLQGEAALPLKAIRQQISSAVDIMIHLSRLRDHSRKTMMVSEILPHLDENGDIRLNPLFEFREDEHSTLQHVSGALVRTENPMIQTDKWTRAGFLLEDIPAPVRK